MHRPFTLLLYYSTTLQTHVCRPRVSVYAAAEGRLKLLCGATLRHSLTTDESFFPRIVSRRLHFHTASRSYSSDRVDPTGATCRKRTFGFSLLFVPEGNERRAGPRRQAVSRAPALTRSVETAASRYNTRAIQLHDVVNLGLIPVVALGTILGILGKVDPVLVSQGFLLYVLIDFVWLVVQPEAVPSLPNVILLHHVVTVVLLYFPLRYNELGIYTCIDGLCEINTFFLIARRQWPRLKDLMDLLYWLTFIPSRTICYPVGTC